MIRFLKQELTRRWPAYVLAVAFVALATWLKYLAEPKIIPADVPILYILAIVPAAIFLGLGPSILVCILSLLAYDYFFIPPLNQINLTNLTEAPIVIIFLLVGVIISLLSSNLRRKNKIAGDEILRRQKTEAELIKYQQNLEEMVKQRTVDLEKSNLNLSQEINERRQAEDQIRLSEQRWATTLASIGDGVIATDVTARISFMNSVAETLTGWRLSEAQGKPVSEIFNIINEHSRQKAENPVDKVIQQGKSCSLANHTILVRRDMSEIAIDDSAAPIKTADGQINGVVLIFRDISQRKKADRILQTTLNRFYAVLSDMPSGVLLVTEEGMIEFANQAFCDIFKIKETPDNLKNLTANEVIEKTRGAYLNPKKEAARILEIVNQWKSVKGEEVPMRDDRLILRDFVPLRLNENKSGRLWVYRDITERRQFIQRLRASEQRFRLALANAPVSIAAQDCDLRFIWAYNQRTIKPAEVMGKTDDDIFLPSDAARLKKLKLEVIATGTEKQERMWLTSNGQKVFLDLFLEPLKNESGNTVGVAIATVDLTEVKIAENALQRSKDRFEILSEANSLLLSAEKPERIVQSIAEKVMAHLDCDCFVNYIADEEAHKLRLNAFAGIPQDMAAGIAWLNYGEAICGCTARDDCRIISENIQENGDMRAELVRSLGMQAYACHPLKIGVTTIGTLSFGTRTRNSFKEDEISLMKTMADQISIAMARKLSEERLSQAVQKLNAHMDNSPLAVIEFDPEFRVIRWSKAAEKIFGWSETEILGKAISEIKWVYQEDVETVDRVSSGFLKGKSPASLNINRNYRKDGTIIYCEWYNSSIYDSEGKLTSVLSQVVDITERKESEEAVETLMNSVQQEKDRLAALVNSIPDEVWLTDANQKFILTNPSARSAFVLNPADQIEVERLAQNLEVYRKDGSLRPLEEAPPLRALKGETIHNLEEMVRTPLSGEIRFRQVSAAPVKDPGGNIIGSVSVVRDITELKKTESDLRQHEKELRETKDYLDNLFTYANAPIIVWDPAFRITRFNHAFERLTGLKADDVIGKKLEILFPVGSRLQAMEHIGSATSGQRMEVEEIPIQNQDGSVRTVLWNSATVFNSDGRSPIATIAQGQDITGRKRAEEAMQRYALELEKHRNHLEEMVKERTGELQSLSYRLIMVQEDERRAISRELHDQIGQSLTVLNLLLAKTLRSPETAKTDIQEATQTVKEVLAQVRNLSSSLHPGMLEDLGLLSTLNWYFNDFGKKTGINIHFKPEGMESRLPPDVNITVYRIIQESLTNIARYAEVKEANVTLILKKQRLFIQIKDKGKGFDVASQSVGVGLRGIRERVNSLKGNLKINSAPGYGTTIEVELPAEEENSSEIVYNESD